jgi:DnaJ-domain-containing protein 1
MRKLADSARAKLRGRSEGNVQGIRGKKLCELSDAELEEELQRRRRERGFSAPSEGAASRKRAPGADRKKTGGPPGWKVRQWFRDLELEPGASRAEVEEAYERLLAKYDPDKYSGDAEKHRAAVRLVVGLRHAYDGLRDHFDAG